MDDILNYSKVSKTADRQKLLKLKTIKELGINPYPYVYDKTISSKEIQVKYKDIENNTKLEKDVYKIAGRLILKRNLGKLMFFDIHDEFGKIQIYIEKVVLSDITQKLLPNLDAGDFIGVDGFIYRTEKGEISIFAKEITLLSKSVALLPEKFHGIADTEIKYRQRFVDLAISPEQRELFKKRSLVISTIRQYFDERGFLEAETPILQPIYGGASAEPFTTHHNALDMLLYLRISDELYLKRLIAGGFEKVYEIGHNFRNEGIDVSHNPEYTSIEWYESYTDYNIQMERTEQLLELIAKKINNGNTKIKYKDMEIDFKSPFRRLSIYDALKQYADVDADKITKEELIAKLKDLHLKVEEKKSRGELLHQFFEETCEKYLVQPTFIIDHMLEVSPLTKPHRKNPKLVERFELYVATKELANAYSELNDPIDQYARLKKQEENREYDVEAMKMDENFIHAMEIGMPPLGGVGIGIDRLIMFMTGIETIKDIILFPTLKNKR
ncbi:MAG: lysine--tRNA ligase [Rickettsiales bacterium]|jgi:lysyl-tRNA synthetase class 2|nr:lysine--tRNA ligase [Rickettsiales bacterium]